MLGLVALTLDAGDRRGAADPRPHGRRTPTAVTALVVTGRSVVCAVGENATRDCGHVRLWDTGDAGPLDVRRLDDPDCGEGLSAGSGVSAVATSGRRVFWVTYIGGNIREYPLWTATPARQVATPARRRVEATATSVRPLVLGVGTREGVPYAARRHGHLRRATTDAGSSA